MFKSIIGKKNCLIQKLAIFLLKTKTTSIQGKSTVLLLMSAGRESSYQTDSTCAHVKWQLQSLLFYVLLAYMKIMLVWNSNLWSNAVTALLRLLLACLICVNQNDKIELKCQRIPLTFIKTNILSYSTNICWKCIATFGDGVLFSSQ